MKQHHRHGQLGMNSRIVARRRPAIEIAGYTLQSLPQGRLIHLIEPEEAL
ncbi:MAG TPA: hypothetical protein VF952_02925 [Chloroflexia bacterium]